jgi:hypothetical protein
LIFIRCLRPERRRAHAGSILPNSRSNCSDISALYRPFGASTDRVVVRLRALAPHWPGFPRQLPYVSAAIRRFRSGTRLALPDGDHITIRSREKIFVFFNLIKRLFNI